MPYPPYGTPLSDASTYQAVFGDAQDHLLVEVAAAEVLGDGQPAQAVAGVVKIPGPGGGNPRALS